MNTGRKYYFLKIAETLNITRAAEQLLVSQPSLTQYLNRLEADLEVKLVDRNYTPLRLTQAGELYADYLRDSRVREERFSTELEELKNQNRSPLRIGIPLQKRHEKLSKTLLDFCMARPYLDVRVWEGTSATVRERIRKGELEIGFGHRVDTDDDDNVVQILNREKIVLICNEKNPLAAGKESSVQKTIRVESKPLEGQLFYQMSPEYFLYEVETEHLKRHGINSQQRIVMSNLHGIIDSILQNPQTGFAYMPDYVLREHWPKSVSDQLAFMRLDEDDFAWFFCMERKKGKKLSKNGSDFWDMVMKACCDGTDE